MLDIVLARKLVEADVEFAPTREDVTDQAPDGTQVRDVAADEIFEHIQVVRAYQHVADRRLAVSACASDFLGVVLHPCTLR